MARSLQMPDDDDDFVLTEIRANIRLALIKAIMSDMREIDDIVRELAEDHLGLEPTLRELQVAYHAKMDI
jgi:hypothetical protein